MPLLRLSFWLGKKEMKSIAHGLFYRKMKYWSLSCRLVPILFTGIVLVTLPQPLLAVQYL